MVTTNTLISPFLLPWQKQGVDFLLQDTEVEASFSLCHAKASMPAPRKPVPQHDQHPMQRAVPPQQSPQHVQPYSSPQGGSREAVKARYQATTQGQQPRQPQHRQQQGQNQVQQQGQPWAQKREQMQRQQAPQERQAPQRVSAPNRVQVPQGAFIPQDSALNAQWQDRLHRTKAARVLWTYWNLGNDLCGQASPERRALLQQILRDLKHPVGTHSFWPIALPEQGVLTPNIPAFWEGAEHLGARVLIVLGDDAAEALGFPLTSIPIKQLKHRGMAIILAKDMDVLIQNPQMYTRTMTYLHPFLTQYLRLNASS